MLRVVSCSLALQFATNPAHSSYVKILKIAISFCFCLCRSWEDLSYNISGVALQESSAARELRRKTWWMEWEWEVDTN